IPHHFTTRINLENELTIGSGIDIIGSGPVGTDERGPIISFPGDSHGIVFTGVGDPAYTGTGGSVQNLKLRARTHMSGDALTITAAGKDSRSGEMLLQRLLIYGDGHGDGVRGTADRGIVIDGSMLRQPGAAGIRRVTMHDIRIADTRRESILLNNAVHCSMTSVQIDTGVGVLPVLRIVDGQNIVGTNLIINGQVILEGTANDIMLSGRFDEVIVKSTVRNCVITGPVRALYVEPGATGAFYGIAKIIEDRSQTGFTRFAHKLTP
ncbi:MAG: hypothetical protein Q8K78_08715, partial [Planctomycetaceae bacterium]|nr:hypothetical protein [Planctomycetaceae bacterium]